ncbi:MAG: dTDP-4-dehydrorhamnose reductase [Thermoprotei archaeon]
MKIFVTGGTGLLGYNLLKVLSTKGYSVYATYHSHEPPSVDGVKWLRLNLENTTEIIDVFNSVKPDIVIHSAAYTDVDGCEKNKQKAYVVNYIATKVIAKQVAKQSGFMIYISTDYVFDGEKGLYRENDVPNPINFYGLTKLLGEIAAQNILDEEHSLVIRVSGLYGYSPTGKKNFGVNALEKLMRKEEVTAFIDQYLSPTYVYFLSERITKAIEKKIHGIIHIAGQRMNRYEFATLLARTLGVNEELVKPTTMNNLRLVARRPRDSSLDTSYAKSLKLDMPSQEECVKHFVETYLKEVR